MADLTTASTFVRSVQGNKRIVYVDVTSAGGTESDTVQTGLGLVQYVDAFLRTTVIGLSATTVVVTATTVTTAHSTVASSGCFASTADAAASLNAINAAVLDLGVERGALNAIVGDVSEGRGGIRARAATASTDAGRVIVIRSAGAVGTPFTIYAVGAR